MNKLEEQAAEQIAELTDKEALSMYADIKRQVKEAGIVLKALNERFNTLLGDDEALELHGHKIHRRINMRYTYSLERVASVIEDEEQLLSVVKVNNTALEDFMKRDILTTEQIISIQETREGKEIKSSIKVE